MRFSTADTAALVQGMRHSVARLVLGYHGAVELDWDTLLTYDGRGRCGWVGCYHLTRRKHGDLLAIWGENMGWGVKKNPRTEGVSVYIYCL